MVYVFVYVCVCVVCVGVGGLINFQVAYAWFERRESVVGGFGGFDGWAVCVLLPLFGGGLVLDLLFVIIGSWWRSVGGNGGFEFVSY